MKIYPNPASDKIFFKGLEKPAMVSIYSIRGEKILESEITSSKNTLDLSMANGMYVLKIQTDSGIFTEKLIIK